MVIGPAPFDHVDRPGQELLTGLEVYGIKPVLVTGAADLEGLRSDETYSLALLDVGAVGAEELRECALRCVRLRLPVIALMPQRRVADLDPALGIDDFVLMPPRPGELLARARWVLNRKGTPEGSDIVRAGRLMINTANFEVAVNGRRVSLRFKEYELLLLMASNPGKVFTREALLNQVWGYNYLGGTRTVDVHVRRLRSKIEDSEHLFIETVWQVGYRFRETDDRA